MSCGSTAKSVAASPSKGIQKWRSKLAAMVCAHAENFQHELMRYDKGGGGEGAKGLAVTRGVGFNKQKKNHKSTGWSEKTNKKK